MQFNSPWIFSLLLLLPLVLVLRRRFSGRTALRFSATSHLREMKASFRQRWIWLPLLLRMLLLAVIIAALARPQEGHERIRELSKGIAIEMVVDRSSSMGAEMSYDGTRATRLDVVKKVFEEFVSGQGKLGGRPNDLIGMIAFAGYADTVCPLTLAHGALSEFLKSVKLVQRKSEDGTGIGDAIALAAARLQTAEETLARQTQEDADAYEIKSKIIILLTDGRSNMGRRSPEQAAQLAKEWGIKVYTIGIGGAEGFLRQHGIFGSFLTGVGEGVDKATLTRIAKSTGGIFRMAEDAQALRDIYEEINELERSEIESVRFLDYSELFQPLALLALVLLSAEILLSCTIFRKIP